MSEGEVRKDNHRKKKLKKKSAHFAQFCCFLGKRKKNLFGCDRCVQGKLRQNVQCVDKYFHEVILGSAALYPFHVYVSLSLSLTHTHYLNCSHHTDVDGLGRDPMVVGLEGCGLQSRLCHLNSIQMVVYMQRYKQTTLSSGNAAG